MPVPVSTSISFHNVRRITASTTATEGAPLSLELKGEGPWSSTVTIFTDNPFITAALIEAINSVCAPTPATPAPAAFPHPNDYRD